MASNTSYVRAEGEVRILGLVLLGLQVRWIVGMSLSKGNVQNDAEWTLYIFHWRGCLRRRGHVKTSTSGPLCPLSVPLLLSSSFPPSP